MLMSSEIVLRYVVSADDTVSPWCRRQSWRTHQFFIAIGSRWVECLLTKWLLDQTVSSCAAVLQAQQVDFEKRELEDDQSSEGDHLLDVEAARLSAVPRIRIIMDLWMENLMGSG
jgi:hypothetical protein